jgi:hypothetical protein
MDISTYAKVRDTSRTLDRVLLNLLDWYMVSTKAANKFYPSSVNTDINFELTQDEFTQWLLEYYDYTYSDWFLPEVSKCDIDEALTNFKLLKPLFDIGQYKRIIKFTDDSPMLLVAWNAKNEKFEISFSNTRQLTKAR